MIKKLTEEQKRRRKRAQTRRQNALHSSPYKGIDKEINFGSFSAKDKDETRKYFKYYPVSSYIKGI